MAKPKWIKTKHQGIYSYETKKGTMYAIRVRYRDWSSKWKEKSESGFETLKKAKIRKTQLESLIHKEATSILEADNTTFKEWYTQYYKITEPTWTVDTKKKIDGYYKNHFKEFDHFPLSKLNLLHYQKFINKKLFEENLAFTTVKAIDAQFRAIINSAVKHELLQKNKLVDVIIQKEHTPKQKNIELEKLLEFDRVAKEIYDVMEYGMYVLLRIGWRRGEVMGFTKGAFRQIDKNTVDVSVIKSRTTNSSSEGKVPKTQSSYRTNRLTDEMAHAIVDAIELAEKLYKRFNLDWGDESFIFVNYKDCQPFFPTHLGRVLAKVSKKTGIKVTPHMFRHTFATRSIANKENPVEVARWLGHAKVDMTLNTYSHSTKESSQELVNFANKEFDLNTEREEIDINIERETISFTSILAKFNENNKVREALSGYAKHFIAKDLYGRIETMNKEERDIFNFLYTEHLSEDNITSYISTINEYLNFSTASEEYNINVIFREYLLSKNLKKSLINLTLVDIRKEIRKIRPH